MPPGEEGRRRRAHAGERDLAQAETLTQVKALFGAAALDGSGDMIGSMLVMTAGSREDLDAWLRVQPYAVDDVWREVAPAARRRLRAAQAGRRRRHHEPPPPPPPPLPTLPPSNPLPLELELPPPAVPPPEPLEDG